MEEWLKGTVEWESPLEEVPEPCVTEMKIAPAHSLLTTPSCCISGDINCERFSSIHKQYRVTAYTLKFIRLLQKKVQSPELTVSDMAKAEGIWMRESQSSMVDDRRFPMWKVQFSLFQDDDHIWRCGGRLQNVDLSFSAKHPILLNKKHCITALIVRSAHQRVQHNGVKDTLAEIRSKYWIIGGKSLVRMLIHRCVVCRRFEGRPFNPPPAPPLPSFRVNEAPPFAFTAVDFVGPVYLRSKEAGSNKAWICLFTCCVTRAIHLELVLDMSAPTFIRALKRFSARRGLPKKILSDNAKTFKAAAKTLNTVFKDPDVKSYLSQACVEWNFNLEKAPWWGGVFERLVKSTKRCLRKMLGQAKFSGDEMHALVETEAILNSHPLSNIDADDTEEPLTPSHHLTGRQILSVLDNFIACDIDDEDFEVSDESLQRRVRHLNAVLNHFWKQWRREYLLELRDAHRQRPGTQTTTPVKIGDVVVVHEEGCPRGFWKVAKVERLITGRDGLVRGAVLKLPSKNHRNVTLQRPLQLLYPLGVAQTEPSVEPEQSATTHNPLKDSTTLSEEDVTPAVDSMEPSRPPRRAAALRARDVSLSLWTLVDHLWSTWGRMSRLSNLLMHS